MKYQKDFLNWQEQSKDMWSQQDIRQDILSQAIRMPVWKPIDRIKELPGAWEIVDDITYDHTTGENREVYIHQLKVNALICALKVHGLNPLAICSVPFYEGFIMGVRHSYLDEDAESFIYLSGAESKYLCLVNMDAYRKHELTCAICGGLTKGAQWYNRDDGYGVCVDCVKEFRHEDRADFYDCYGKEGLNYPYIMPVYRLSI
jgi:hypothetical protein